LAGTSAKSIFPTGDSMIAINLMGRLDVRGPGGAAIAINSRRSTALLACLGAGEDESWSRERLAALLWTGRGADQARASLRQELFRLRRMLGGLRIAAWADGRDLTLPADSFAIDVRDFRAACRQRSGYRRAIALFRGPLLQDVAPDDGPFGQWLRRQRRVLQEVMADCLRRAIVDRLGAGDHAEAGDLARRLLRLDAGFDRSQEPLLGAEEKRELSELWLRRESAPGLASPPGAGAAIAD